MDKKLTKVVLISLALLCVAAVIYVSLDVSSAQDDLYSLEEISNYRNVPSKINFIEEWENMVELTRKEIIETDPANPEEPGDNNIPSKGDNTSNNGTSEGGGKLVTYYSHGDNSGVVLTDDGGTGWLGLYDAPTCVSSSTSNFSVSTVYEKYLGSSSTAKVALQSFGGSATGPNKSAGDFNAFFDGGGSCNLESSGIKGAKSGTINVGGVDRHMIALGPSFMIKEQPWKNTKVSGSKMKYGTLVDIKATVNGTVYYIPCIVVDIKNHTAENGFIQTGYSITDGSFVSSATDPACVEWYGVKTKREYSGNISSGLKYFSDIEIIIYRDNKL